MNVGIVGTGNIGSTLIEGIYYSHTFRENVFAFNRTRKKVEDLGSKYPCLNVCNRMDDVVAQSSILILAVPFSCIQNLSNSVSNLLRDKGPLVIALCGYAPMDLLEQYLPTKVAKAYPNINWAIREGVTIVHFGKRCNIEDKKKVIDFLEVLGAAYEVCENKLRPLANITGCGPALWAKMIQLFIQGNAEKYGIDDKIGMELAQKTIQGTFRLMQEKGWNVEQVIDKVVSPGGTTEIALKYFESFLPRVFKDTIEEISGRDRERLESCLRAIRV
jgi:competence protein ComER